MDISLKFLTFAGMKLKVCHNMRILVLLSAVVMLLSACSNDDTNSPADTSNDAPEIRINADVWQVIPGTRATTYDNAEALQTEGSFACTTYYANTITPYFIDAVANWNTTDNLWEFASRRTWPRNNQALDFFAYMPASKPDYITNIYTSARIPQFTCTLPMADSGSGTIKEYVCAMTIGQDEEHQGQENTGVTMRFYHPFARLKFQLSVSHPDITIETITFKNLKSGGTCTFSPTPSGATMYNTFAWSSLTPTDGTVDFVATINQECHDNPASVVPLGETYLVVPQTFAGDITVKAKWIDWGEQFSHNVSTTLPASITWQAGYSYTYTFTITETDLIVKTDKFTEQW